MNETKKPVIRFQGFSGEWKQRRVGELIEDYTEKTVVQNQYPVLTSSQQQGIVRQEEYFADRQVTTNDNVGYFVLPFGYFTYRSRSDTDVFVFNRNNLIDKGIISYYYPVFAPMSCDSNFLLRRLNYGIKKQLSMAAEGTGQKVLAHSKFKDMIVDVPDEEEQIKIGTVFEYLDNLIAQHQSKLEKLQSLKASMLEKMFPKNGSDVPDIRFKGFTKAWIKRKIGECFVERNESFPDGELLSVTINNGVRKFSELDRRDTSNSDKSKYKKVCVGDIAYNSMRMWQGASGYSPYEGIVSPAYTVLSPNPGINSKCIAYYFKSDEIVQTFQKNSQGITSDNWNLKFPALSKIEIRISPNMEEQKKIAAYFSQLDALIYQFEQEVAKLQSIKKALLEKMLV